MNIELDLPASRLGFCIWIRVASIDVVVESGPVGLQEQPVHTPMSVVEDIRERQRVILHVSIWLCVRGSKLGSQNGTLVNGNKD